jgi:hypothetical protein
VKRGRKRVNVLERCSSCGAPRAAHVCVLCKNLNFTRIYIRTLDVEQLRILACELHGRLRSVERDLAALRAPGEPRDEQEFARPRTSRTSGRSDGTTPASLDLNTLRSLIDELTYLIRLNIKKLLHERKLEQFKNSKKVYQVGSRKSVKAVSGGLPESNRRKF